MSSSSESHVTHDLNASPNRYSMVRFPGSAGLLPAIRPDGEWVIEADAKDEDEYAAVLVAARAALPNTTGEAE